MRRLYILGLVAVSLNCPAQSQYNSAAHTNITFQTRPLGFITSFQPAPSSGIDSYYLFDNWMQGDIYMKDSTKLAGLNIKIDLRQEALNIQYNNEVKILPFTRVLALSLINGSGEVIEFINGGFLPGSRSVYADRLLEVVSGNGPFKLYCDTQTEIVPAQRNPNPMLSVVEDEDKVVMHKKYLIVKEKQVVEVGNSKSVLKEDMTKSFGAEVEPFLKKVNPKREEDLLLLVKALNDHFKS